MLEIVNIIISWSAVFLRAGGMLAKDPMRIKWLVSGGNFGWLVSGILTGNVPLVASNALCLIIMGVEVVKDRKKSKK